ncbi:MAG: DUF2142 domain-containing protein, partial [Actinomycetota bacterium]|nr:DUF2142 domain-containing protein [Actinomycetota bacterium]
MAARGGCSAPPSRLPLLLVLSYALLAVAWVVGNPAGAAPDETAHYLKGLAVAGGQPAGRPVDLAPSPGDSRREAWMKRTTRGVDVPAGLSPAGLQCNALLPLESAGCQVAARPPDQPSKGLTHVGTHQPLLYVVPGLLAHAAHEPVTAIRLGRLGNAATCLALLALAVSVLWDRGAGALSVLGLVLAVTPMVVFLSSSLTPSGPEVAGGICFFAALLRLGRPATDTGPVWAVLAVSGVVLASSRSLGPLWVVLLALVAVATHGAKESWRTVRAGGRRAVWAWAAVAVAVAASVAWELAVQPHGRIDTAHLRHLLVPSVRQLPEILKQQIGVFGSLDAAMPPIAYRCWSLALLVLVVLAARVAPRRPRAVLIALPLAVAALTVAVAAVNRSQTGFGMQGRYVLAVAVAVPLLAGELLSRHRRADAVLPPRALLSLGLAPAAGLHALGWYANARRSATGTDVGWLFIGRSEWSPGVGWYPLVALVALAAALMA